MKYFGLQVGFQPCKGFCNAFLVFILAKELSYHFLPNIGHIYRTGGLRTL